MYTFPSFIGKITSSIRFVFFHLFDFVHRLPRSLDVWVTVHICCARSHVMLKMAVERDVLRRKTGKQEGTISTENDTVSGQRNTQCTLRDLKYKNK